MKHRQFYESFSAVIPAGSEEHRQSTDAEARLRQSPSAEPAAAPESLLLDFPHYTRPAEFRGWSVPEVLLGGNHEQIRRWRRQAALEKTHRNRPDLINGVS